MRSTSSDTNSISGSDDQPQQGESVFVSYKADANIDASDVTDTIIVAFGARDYINLDNSTEPNGGLGSDNTVFTFGNNTNIDVGSSANNDVYLFGKNDTLEGLSNPGSTDLVHVEGRNAQIDIGGARSGDNSVFLDSTGANVTILPGTYADSEFPFGNDTVTASGTGSDTVTGGGFAFVFDGAKGHYDIDGGVAANSTISGGSGGGTFTGGWLDTGRIDANGKPIYVGTNSITAGTQSSTVVGGAYGSSTLTAAGKAGDVLVAGEFGNDTLSGGNSTGNNLYEGFTGIYRGGYDPNTATVVIQAGKGNDTLVGGYAPETMTGGAGSDVFRFEQLYSSDHRSTPTTLITDFTHGVDKLDIQGYGETAKQIIAQETVSGGSTHISLYDGTSITLAHVTGLTASDFTHS